MNELLITIIGIVSTAISSFITWFITRKKYNSEVDGSDIKNLADSLEIYSKITLENKKTIEHYIKIVEDERIRNYIMTTMTFKILDKSCTKSNCLERQFYTEEEINEIFDIINRKVSKSKNKEESVPINN